MELGVEALHHLQPDQFVNALLVEETLNRPRRCQITQATAYALGSLALGVSKAARRKFEQRGFFELRASAVERGRSVTVSLFGNMCGNQKF